MHNRKQKEKMNMNNFKNFGQILQFHRRIIPNDKVQSLQFYSRIIKIVNAM